VFRRQADLDCDGAIAKWQALAEEAGAQHSGLACAIAAIQEDPRSNLSLERSCLEQIKDLLGNTFARREIRTLLGRAGHDSFFIRWRKSM